MNFYKYDYLKIDLYYQQFGESDNSRQKLWLLSLVAIFFPQTQIKINVMYTQNLNNLFACFRNVLNSNQEVLPYNMGYNSDEEALYIQQDKYMHLINVLTKQVS
jgi:hypothetical protein